MGVTYSVLVFVIVILVFVITEMAHIHREQNEEWERYTRRLCRYIKELEEEVDSIRGEN